ncbi:caspase-3 [Reticulomyxa filosa]|uniref:Caspase-3 n=1 Tax=Reticulomyxa filosa TaxID=46433 RepID=X6N8C8_RETFI|nr:caspase-3 [Reticulomyxa filosa]|eukprot:ETO22535.1 caspase-3 [Reticulomyxa filosa]
MGNQNTIPFQSLMNLPNQFSESQCMLHKYELLVCGGYLQRNCYSYHTIKKEYKFICKYPSNVKVFGHCVVKLVNDNNNNNKDKNEITLLSFGGYSKHTLMMKYVSVWSNDNENNNDSEMNKSKQVQKSNDYNKWIPFTDNHNDPINIGRDEDNYWGVRAVIGGSGNNLLFITYLQNNISVFDLNKFQFIKHDTLLTDSWIQYHCFVSKPENGQEINEEKKKKTGLSIEYDEDNNTFQFHQLPVCDDIASFHHYAYVYINDVILFFGGSNGYGTVSKSVHKYSIRENKWMTFQNALPSPLCTCTAILSEDSKYVYIIGGSNGQEHMSTHMKTKVSKWLNAEMNKGIELKVKEEKENETDKTVKKRTSVLSIEFELELYKKEEKRKWTKWWKERSEIDKEEIISKFEQLSTNDFESWLLLQSKWKHDLNNENIVAIYAAIESYIDYHSTDKEKIKKWMKWWDEREQKDKTEIIEKFKTMSNEQFRVWLLNECKCKYEITKNDIVSIEAFLNLTAINQNNKEKEVNQLSLFYAYVILDERKKSIKMKELTFEELLRQSHSCLEWKDFQKMRNDNLKIELTDMKDNIIESDEAVKKEFESNEPTFKIIWTSCQQPVILGKTKTIKNAFVIIIAISEYGNNEWKNLKNVKEKDIQNFKQLFGQELNYEIVCTPSSKMTKSDVDEFMDQIKISFKLRTNNNKYDGLIVIICGHGDSGNMLVASDGKYVSIDKIRSSFNCHEMESFKDFPKIFIIDICRGENIPKAHEIAMRGNEISYGHNDDGFLIIWSTTKGHRVADLSLFSECMKNTVTTKYKNSYPFKQMLHDIRTEIRKKKCSEWYCVESQDTTDYDIIFKQRESEQNPCGSLI